MAFKVEKVDVWTGDIRDEAGGLDSVIEPLVLAGADFSFVLARRRPERPGSGVVFLSGVRGTRQIKAAQALGLRKDPDLGCVRIEASDKPGLVGDLLGKLARARISVRGVSASVIGAKCVVLISFDSQSARDQVFKLLKK